MPRKKQQSGPMTLVMDTDGSANVQEDIMEQLAQIEQTKSMPPTFGELQDLALAMPSPEERQQLPSNAQEPKKEGPPPEVDYAWAIDYARQKGLVPRISGSNGKFVCTIHDTSGKTIIGSDPHTRQPLAFGMTQGRALVNAIEQHKRLKAQETPMLVQAPASITQNEQALADYRAYLENQAGPILAMQPARYASPAEIDTYKIVAGELLESLEELVCLIVDRKLNVQAARTNHNDGIKQELARLLQKL